MAMTWGEMCKESYVTWHELRDLWESLTGHPIPPGKGIEAVTWYERKRDTRHCLSDEPDEEFAPLTRMSPQV